ncbi:MAG: hypothetical protein MOB07_16230 [Acidobacteria bacterium]|nr:hypothetical protein [Acidobacteriota bacterium]
MRPQEIDKLIPALEQLACCGGVSTNVNDGDWLLLVGAAWKNEETGWLLADWEWIDSSLPARDELDLLRKTAIRDPRYRFHLDVMISSVLQAIARSCRWARLEELLGGPFINFAPRFVQLLELASSETGTACLELTEASWQGLARRIEGDDADTFEKWDSALWGDVRGGAVAIFPLLTDLYAPLVGRAVNVNTRLEDIDENTEWLLVQLIKSGMIAEGVYLSDERRTVLGQLWRLGLPVRRWLSATGGTPHVLAGLVGPVRLIARNASFVHTSDGAQLFCVERDLIRKSQALSFDQDGPKALPEGLWTVWKEKIEALATPGISSKSGNWPREQSDAPQSPQWSCVPPLANLEAIAQSRSKSPEVDQSLLLLGQHILFGFLIQLLLVDALDRELGQETLTLKPPMDQKVENIEYATHVLYRPASDPGVNDDVALPEYDLGSLDDVLGMVAEKFGIRGAPLIFRSENNGAWSNALSLLRAAGVVVGRHYGWAIDEAVLDRLHGGGLMTGVLRRGRDMRDRIREELRLLWDEANRRARRLEGAHA